MNKAETIDQQLAEAQRKVEMIKEKKRKLETRKKIVAGAAMIEWLTHENLMNFLNQNLKRKEDRQLWGLPDRNEEVQNVVEESHNVERFEENKN